MGLTIGELRVQIEARTAKFQRSLKTAESRVRRFATKGKAALAGLGRGFSALRANIGTLAAGGGIIAGLGLALTAAARAAASSVDEIAKSARAANLTAEEFQQLRFAADEAGVATQGFSNSLILFNRNIAEALTGIGPAKDAFSLLNIEIENLDGTLKPVRQIFDDVSDALNTVESGAQRAGLAFDLFGRQGAKLAPLLALGSDAIREQGEEASRLGLIFSDEVVFNAEAVNDAFNRLSNVISVQLKSALIDIAPTLLNLASVVFPLIGKTITTVIRTFSLFQGILAEIQVGVVLVSESLQIIGSAALAASTITVNAFRQIGAAARLDFEEVSRLADANVAALKKVSDQVEQSGNNIAAAQGVANEAFARLGNDAALNKLEQTFDNIGESAGKFAAEIERGDFASRAEAEAAARSKSTVILQDQEQLLRDQATASNRLLTIENQRALAAARTRDPLEASRLAIERQIEGLQALTLGDEERERANRVIAELQAEQADLLARQQAATAGLATAEAQARARVAQVELFDPERAEEFAAQIDAALTSAIGSEAQVAKLEALGKTAADLITSGQVAAAEELLGIEQDRALAAAEAREPLEGQRIEIDRQIESIRQLTLDEAGRERANAVIVQLQQEQADLLARQQVATEALAGAELATRTRIRRVTVFDPEAAEEFAEQLDEALANAVGSEAQLAALDDLGEKAQDAIEAAAERSGPTFAESLSGNLQQSFQASLEDGGQGFLRTFGDSLRETAAEQLSQGFAEAAQNLADTLTDFLVNDFGPLLADVFGSSSSSGTREGFAGTSGFLGGFLGDIFSSSSEKGTKEGVTKGAKEGAEAGGSAFGASFASVTVGVIGAALRRETQTSTSLLRSAVTGGGTVSAQQARGVVVGAGVQIGVGQVGRAIEDANIEVVRQLMIIARNTTPRSSAPGSLGTDSDEVAETLANESESFI